MIIRRGLIFSALCLALSLGVHLIEQQLPAGPIGNLWRYIFKNIKPVALILGGTFALLSLAAYTGRRHRKNSKPDKVIAKYFLLGWCMLLLTGASAWWIGHQQMHQLANAIAYVGGFSGLVFISIAAYFSDEKPNTEE